MFDVDIQLIPLASMFKAYGKNNPLFFTRVVDLVNI